jgi:AraC-like DNA-binding protein
VAQPVLLADGTPVTTTALACGWSNPSAFIETFRRAFGATPGKFYAGTGSRDPHDTP